MTTISLGKVVSWESPAGEVQLGILRAAVLRQGFDSSLVADMAPRSAFLRACKDMLADKKNRLIRKLEETSSEIKFQFTEEKKGFGELDYDKEAIVSVEKATGNLSGDDPAIVSKAQDLLNEHAQKRSTADVTRLIQKIFDKSKGDLVPLRAQGGVYFVPDSQRDLLDRIEAILAEIGGKLNQYTVNGDAQSRKSVANDMMGYIRNLIGDLRDSCSRVDMNSKETTRKRREDDMRAAELKLSNCSHLLGSFQATLVKELKEVKADYLLRTTGVDVRQSTPTPPVAPVSTQTIVAPPPPVQTIPLNRPAPPPPVQQAGRAIRPAPPALPKKLA